MWRFFVSIGEETAFLITYISSDKRLVLHRCIF